MEPSYGIGETYQRAVDPKENINQWNVLLDKIAKWKFNTVRLAFIFPGIMPTPHSAPPLAPDLALLKDVLNLLQVRGLKAVLDLHNYLDMPHYFGSPEWKNNWKALVNAIKDHPAVAAYELFNEPCNNSTQATWHTSILTSDDAWRAYGYLTNELRMIDPTKPIIWAAPHCGIGYAPPSDVVVWAKDKNIVFAFHPWSNRSIATHEEADANVARFIGDMKTVKAAGFIAWNGECGVHFTDGGRYEIEKYYCVKLFNECIANGFGFNWWLYTKNHWYVGSADEVIGASDYHEIAHVFVEEYKGWNIYSYMDGMIPTFYAEKDYDRSATFTSISVLKAWIDSLDQPPPPPPPGSLAARSVGPFGVPSCLLHQFWRLRERFISKEVHKKLHPLV